MTRDEYDAIDAVNFSTLKHILRSPAHYKAALYDLEHEQEEKFVVGNLAHAMVLEGRDLRSMYAIKPKGMSFASKEGKAWRDAQTLPILKEDDANRIPQMAEAIAKHPTAASLLNRCQFREHCVNIQMDGIDFKALLDAADALDQIGFVDIKTTNDARPRSFSKKVLDFHYDMQADLYARLLAMTTDMEKPPFFSWIVVEDKPPFAVACYTPSPTVMATGAQKLDTAIELLKKCRAEDHWPSYQEGLQDLELPDWRHAKDI